MGKEKHVEKGDITDVKTEELTLWNIFDKGLAPFRIDSARMTKEDDYSVLMAEEMVIERGTDMLIQVVSEFLTTDV